VVTHLPQVRSSPPTTNAAWSAREVTLNTVEREDSLCCTARTRLLPVLHLLRAQLRDRCPLLAHLQFPPLQASPALLQLPLRLLLFKFHLLLITLTWDASTKHTIAELSPIMVALHLPTLWNHALHSAVAIDFLERSMAQSAIVETLSTQTRSFRQMKVVVMCPAQRTHLRSAAVLTSSTSTTPMSQPRPRQAVLQAHQPVPWLSNLLAATHPWDATPRPPMAAL